MGRLHRLIGAVLGACALVVSGCVVIKSQNATQLDTIGRVRLTTVICASQQGRSGSQCDDDGNADQNAANDSGSTETQLLLAYRVPAGTTPPDAFTSTDAQPVTSASLTFTRSPSYETELDGVLPPPAGQQWVGYISAPFKYTYDPSVQWSAQPTPQQVTVQPQFGLPVGVDGAPFKGPFAYRAIAGWRRSNTGASAPAGTTSSRPVRCTADPTTAGSATDTQCADSPAKAAIGTNLELATRDAGIVGGPAVTASHGTTARVPFRFGFLGTLSAQTPLTFTLRGGTTLPGASATSSRTTVTVTGDSSTDVDVAVPVGDGVAPGDYTVTLTATLPNGQQRTQQRVLTVPGPPVAATPPTVNGDPLAGALLTASPGDWRSFAPPALAYSWLRCDARGGNCMAIDGADGPGLRVADADAGRRLRLEVAASTPDGVTRATSEPTERVIDRRSPTLKVTLRKTRFTRRQFLRGVPVRVDPSEPVRMTFQLLTTTRRARIAAARNLILGTRTVPGTNIPTALLVRPRKALVRGNRRFSVTVVVTARDASRNARTVRRLIRVRG